MMAPARCDGKLETSCGSPLPANFIKGGGESVATLLLPLSLLHIDHVSEPRRTTGTLQRQHTQPFCASDAIGFVLVNQISKWL